MALRSPRWFRIQTTQRRQGSESQSCVHVVFIDGALSSRLRSRCSIFFRLKRFHYDDDAECEDRMITTYSVHELLFSVPPTSLHVYNLCNENVLNNRRRISSTQTLCTAVTTEVTSAATHKPRVDTLFLARKHTHRGGIQEHRPGGIGREKIPPWETKQQYFAVDKVGGQSNLR